MASIHNHNLCFRLFVGSIQNKLQLAPKILVHRLRSRDTLAPCIVWQICNKNCSFAARFCSAFFQKWRERCYFFPLCVFLLFGLVFCHRMLVFLLNVFHNIQHDVLWQVFIFLSFSLLFSSIAKRNIGYIARISEISLEKRSHGCGKALPVASLLWIRSHWAISFEYHLNYGWKQIHRCEWIAMEITHAPILQMMLYTYLYVSFNKLGICIFM